MIVASDASQGGKRWNKGKSRAAQERAVTLSGGLRNISQGEGDLNWDHKDE